MHRWQLEDPGETAQENRRLGGHRKSFVRSLSLSMSSIEGLYGELDSW